MRNFWLTALALGLSIGCAHPSKQMPIGIFYPSTNIFSELADAGFNLVVAPPSREVLDRAHAAGLSVLIDAGMNVQGLAELDRHPAAWGWYLRDEPDLHQISPQRMVAENRRVKRFARKPTVMVLASGSAVEKYAGIADVMAVDWYPVPWTSVGTVAREMRLARLGADGRPFLAVLQAFDWTDARAQLRTEAPLRAPTYDELRCMAYLALMQGAEGILFYAYRDRAIDLEQNPALRRAVLRIAAEIREHAKIFKNRISWWPTHTEYHGAAEMMFNEAGEARMSLALFASQDGFHLIAANTTDEAVDFSLKLPVESMRELKTSCATNDFEVKDGWIRKTYAPFEVCILGPMKGELADE